MIVASVVETFLHRFVQTLYASDKIFSALRKLTKRLCRQPAICGIRRTVPVARKVEMRDHWCGDGLELRLARR